VGSFSQRLAVTSGFGADRVISPGTRSHATTKESAHQDASKVTDSCGAVDIVANWANSYSPR
jgi:hypothetical protein